jgi:hypothetical protein
MTKKGIRRQLSVAENGSQQAGTYYFTRMYRNGRCSSVRMAKEEVAAAAAHDLEAELFQDSDEFLAL